LYPLASRMKSIVDGSDGVHLLGESAMHPPAIQQPVELEESKRKFVWARTDFDDFAGQ